MSHLDYPAASEYSLPLKVTDVANMKNSSSETIHWGKFDCILQYTFFSEDFSPGTETFLNFIYINAVKNLQNITNT